MSTERALLPQPSWQRAAAESTGPVVMLRYVTGALLPMGEYPCAQAAMLASDVPVWLAHGRGFRSQDARTLIEPRSAVDEYAIQPVRTS